MEYKKEISAGGIVFLTDGRKLKAQSSKLKIQNKKDNYSESSVKGQMSQVLWLVTKHSKFGHWSFPKGLVGDIRKGEGMQDAALREVEEEGGVKAEIVQKLPVPVYYTYRWQDTLIKKTVYYYLMKYVSGDPKNHDWEVSEAKFVSDKEVEKLLTFENDKKAFRQAVELYDRL